MTHLLRVKHRLKHPVDPSNTPITEHIIHEEVVPLSSFCGVRVVPLFTGDEEKTIVSLITLQLEISGVGTLPGATRLQGLPSRFLAVGQLTKLTDDSRVRQLYDRAGVLIEHLRELPDEDLEIEFIDFDELP